jgi:DNA topoisomerase I
MGFRQSAARLPDAWNRLKADQRRQKEASDRIRSEADSLSALDPVASADVAGLRYVDDTSTAGIKRVGGGHRYLDPRGRAVSSPQVVQRIKALAIPPAWRDVWICPHPLGHVQATGRDARGRKQYRYHPRWRELRDEVKYGRLLAFARALPRIHDRTSADLRRTGLPREKVLAAVVQLLEKTLIRIGNDEYARHNHSYGLTTLLDRHARVTAEGVRFEFRGKSGIAHAVDLRDARLARVVRKCQDLPGHTLFQYIDHDGHRQTIDSADVNAYLREITGDAFTAKDFRTWAGTVLAAQELSARAAFRSQREARSHVLRAVESVAKRLGNTRAVCRKSYIHPAVLAAYMDGETLAPIAPARPSRSARVLAPIEFAVVRVIRRRLQSRRD